MTIKFSTQKSTVLPRIPASITDAATRGFLEDILKHLDRLNRDVRGDFDKLVAGDATLNHSLLVNLAADDHTQYFNTTRGDARFSQLGHDHATAYAALSHAHDDRYFTESESDLRYSLLGHNHDLTYAAIAHNHDLLYSAIGHDHDSDYSAIGHDHDSDYSDIAHNHDLNYSALGHVHNGLYLEIPKFEASNLIVQEPYGETVLNPKICTLTINTIAHFNNYNSKLSCRSFDEESFSIVGNELTISGHAVQSITSLNETDIAVSLWSAGPTRQIRTYRFDGTDWAQVGNSLNRVDLENITAINGTDIATVSTSGTFKNVLRFDGADWTLVGTAQTSYPGVVASLNETDVAFVLNTGSEYVMRTYRFDGNIFTMIGNELALGYDIDDITKVSSVDVAILDYNDLSVRIYRFDGLDWILTSDILDVGAGDAVDVSIIGINGTGLIVANGNSGNLCYYRFCSLAESGVAFYDNISGNVSTAKHGYAPKLPNDNTLYLDGIGGYSFPKTKEVPITIANATGDAVNDITFAAGWVYDSTGVYKLALPSAMTKQSDAAYAAGTGAGGGSLSGSGWFHCYIIRKDSDGTIDCCFNTVPAGHTYYRHVGWIYHTDAAGITEFFQEGNRFRLKTLIQNCATENPGTNAVLQAVTCPPEMLAIVNVSGYNATTTTNSTCIVTSPSETDSAPSDTFFTFANRGGASRFGSAEVVRKTDSSSRIRYRVSYSASTITVYVNSIGWIDTLLK